MAIVVIGEPFYKSGKYDKNNRNARRYVRARCGECGKEWDTEWTRRNKRKSCGCVVNKPIKHGESVSNKGKRSATYKTWMAMRERCLSDKCHKYPMYGGRGIKICERWMEFQNFLDDMGERPEGTTIDRIDRDGDYEPSNCRWSTVVEQNNNKRTNRFLTIYGMTLTLAQWCRIDGQVKLKTARERLERGWSDKESIFGKAKA
jgi:hypothetical protein